MADMSFTEFQNAHAFFPISQLPRDHLQHWVGKLYQADRKSLVCIIKSDVVILMGSSLKGMNFGQD